LERKGGRLDIDDPATFTEYFKSLYDLSRADSRNRELLDAIREMNFLNVAKLYKIIDNGTISVVTPWSQETFTELAREIRAGRLTRGWIQRARGLTVNIFPPQRDAPEWGRLEPVRIATDKDAVDWFLLNASDNYDEFVGIRFQKGLALMEG